MSWVYLIHAVGSDAYKIGRSGNVSARLASLATASPVPLALIAAWNCARASALESALLRLCEPTGGGSEWVRLAHVPLDVFDEVARQHQGVRAQLAIVDRHAPIDSEPVSPPALVSPPTPMPPAGPRFVSAYDVRKRVGVYSEAAWIQLVKNGSVIGKKLGKGWVIDVQDAERYVIAEIGAKGPIQ